MKETLEIAIELIRPNRYQPRLDFNHDGLMELAQSIRENGLIQPIAVRRIGKEYEIIAGERRYRAMRLAGFNVVPCIVNEANETQMAEMALVENLQREDLTAIEEAKAYVKMMQENKLTQEKIAVKMGKSQSSVANKIRLLALPQDVQNAITERKITERHARALLNAEPEERSELFKKIVGMNLNVRQTEQWIDTHNKKKTEEDKKQKTKGITRNVRIAINTINQAVQMITKTGIPVKVQQEEDETEVRMILRFPK